MHETGVDLARANVAMLASLYVGGKKSLPDVAAAARLPISAVRTALLEAGIELRSRADGVRNATPKLSAAHKGKRRSFTDGWCENISKSRQQWAEENALGLSHKSSGFVVHTRGENKDRGLHVTIMEERLGRKLLPDEQVHHIDRNRANNDINNLALVTASGHARLHRFEDALEGKKRNRKNGRLT